MKGSQSFMEELFIENISLDWWTEMIDSSVKLKAQHDWRLCNDDALKAASIAIRTKQPSSIYICCDDDDNDMLNLSFVSSIFANASKQTQVRLNFLDSFFGNGEKKKQHYNELFNICNSNEK